MSENTILYHKIYKKNFYNITFSVNFILYNIICFHVREVKKKTHNYKYNVIMYLCYTSHELFPQHSTLLWDVCNNLTITHNINTTVSL